jgi:hypothetical protein
MFILIVTSLICICSVAFVLSNDSCELQNDQVFLSNDLKTIKSFCQMFSKRSCSLKSSFLIFFSRLSFLFRAQLVHAKVTLSSDRTYYKRDVMMMIEEIVMINESDDHSSLTERKDAFVHLSLDLMTRLLRALSCSLWSSFLVCLAEVTVRSASEDCL